MQPKGTIVPEIHEFDDTLDKQYKPGLYMQVESFINGDLTRFINIEQQRQMGVDVYSKMLL